MHLNDSRASKSSVESRRPSRRFIPLIGSGPSKAFPEPHRRDDRFQTVRTIGPAAVLLAGCLIYYVHSVSQRWKDPLLDLHSFRQTQTAISSYYMLETGPRLLYETPVLGPPWSIPFEFPLYQWIAAAAAGTKLIRLDQAGRLVSVLFFLATLAPARNLLAALKISAPMRLASLALMLVSPFYIYWSRSFLIESTALFLSVCYAALVVRFLRTPRTATALGATAIGALAALVKVTTFAPWFLAAAGFVALDLIRPASPDDAGAGAGRRRRLALLAIMAVVPIVSLVGWTRFADRHKELNALGSYLVSTKLNVWTFGTLSQRTSPETWSLLFERSQTVLGGKWVVFFAAIGVVLANRRVGQFAACIALYLSGPLVFTNLYYIHDYYAFANYPFLIAAVAVALAAMAEAGGVLRREAVVGLLILVALAVHSYRNDPMIGPEHPLETDKLRFARTVRKLTKPDEVIVLLGFEWSPVIPYYSQRRALMLPPWKLLGLTAADAERAVADLKGLKIGALLLSSPQPVGPITAERLKALLAAQGFDGRRHPAPAPFELYLPPRPDEPR